MQILPVTPPHENANIAVSLDNPETLGLCKEKVEPWKSQVASGLWT